MEPSPTKMATNQFKHEKLKDKGSFWIEIHLDNTAILSVAMTTVTMAITHFGNSGKKVLPVTHTEHKFFPIYMQLPEQH